MHAQTCTTTLHKSSWGACMIVRVLSVRLPRVSHCVRERACVSSTSPQFGVRCYFMHRMNATKIGGISILQSAHKQGNPSFGFHAPGSKRRYPCTQTASAVQKYFPLFAPVLYWLSHLICISSLKAKNERKMSIFTQLKISRCKEHF